MDEFDDILKLYKPSTTAKPDAAPQKLAGYSPLNRTSGDKKIDSYYEQYGRDHDVDPNLLFEQGWQESKFKNNARSHKGALGPAQFMPDTAREFNLRVDDEVDERLDPTKAIPAQAKLMRKLLDRTNDIGLSLAGYNSGHNASVEKLRRHVETIAETKDYVARITKKYGLPPNSLSFNNFDEVLGAYASKQEPAPQNFDEILNFYKSPTPENPAQTPQNNPLADLTALKTNLEASLKEATTKKERREIAVSLKKLNQSIAQTRKELPAAQNTLPRPGENLPGETAINPVSPTFPNPALPKVDSAVPTNITDAPATEMPERLQFNQGELRRENGNIYTNADGAKFEITKTADGFTGKELNPKLVLGEGEQQLAQTADQQGVPAGKVRVAAANGDSYLATAKADKKSFDLELERSAPAPITEDDYLAYFAETKQTDTPENRKAFEDLVKQADAENFGKRGEVKSAQFENVIGADGKPIVQKVQASQPFIAQTQQPAVNPQNEPAANNVQETPRDEKPTKIYTDFSPSAVPANKTLKEYANENLARSISSTYGIEIADVIEAQKQSPIKQNGAELGEDDFRKMQANGTALETEVGVGLVKRAREIGAARVANKKATIANLLASGDDLTRVNWEKLSEQGIYEKDVQDALVGNNPLFSKANEIRRTVGDAKEKGNAEYLKALLDTGQISREIYEQRIEADKLDREQLQAEIEQDAKYNTTAQADFGFEMSPAVQPKQYKNVDDLLKQNGVFSASEFIDRREQEAAENHAAWQKVASQPGTATVEFLKNLTRTVPKAVSALSKTISIGAEAVDAGIGGDQTAASERGFFQLGKWLDRQTDAWLPQDKILRKNFIATTLPDTLGQLIVQISTGIATGGVVAPLLLGASQGASAQYDEADKFQADKKIKLLSALVGGIAAAPDALLFTKWLKPFSNVEKAGVISRFLTSFFGKAAEEVGEKEALTLTQALGKNILFGGSVEGIQEPSETKLNDWFASVTYDQSDARIRKLKTIDGSTLEEALAGFIGGSFGGTIQTLGEKETISQKDYDLGLAREYAAKAQAAPDIADSAISSEGEKQATTEPEQPISIVGAKVETEVKGKGKLKGTVSKEIGANNVAVELEDGSVVQRRKNQIDIIENAAPPVENGSAVAAETQPKPKEKEQKIAETTENVAENTDSVAKEAETAANQNDQSGIPVVTNRREQVQGLSFDDDSLDADSEKVDNISTNSKEDGESKTVFDKVPSNFDKKSATDAAHEAALSPLNDLPEPTEAQKEAGNYKKGHISIGGLNLSIENPVGSERTGVDRGGKPWSVKMNHHYGYIKNSVGADKEHIDVFVKDNTAAEFSGNVFVVDQIHPDSGKFDEHKVMLGYDTETEARRAYLSNYTKDWKGLSKITAMPMAEFKNWATSAERSQPLSKSPALTNRSRIIELEVDNSSDFEDVINKLKRGQYLDNGKLDDLYIEFENNEKSKSEFLAELENIAKAEGYDGIAFDETGSPEVLTPTAEQEITLPAQNETEQKSSDNEKIVTIGDKQITLSPEQAARWNEEVELPLQLAKQKRDGDIKQNPALNTQRANEEYKGTAMRIAAIKREITGELTDLERAAAEKYEKSNYIGKDVSASGKNGKVVGNPFGRVKVEFPDGTQKTFDRGEIDEPIEKAGNKNENPNLPDWVNQNNDNYVAEAERLGITDEIKELAERGLTAKQIGFELRKNHPNLPTEITNLIRAVRAKNNIPSVDEVESEKVNSELLTDADVQNKAHDIISELFDEQPTPKVKANPNNRQRGFKFTPKKEQPDSGLKQSRDFASNSAINEIEGADLGELVENAKVADLVRDKYKLETASLEIYEIVRRAVEENEFQKGVNENQRFDAIFLNPNDIRAVAKILRDGAKDAVSSGITATNAAKLELIAQTIEDAGKVDGSAIVYLFDDAIPHEEWHKSGFHQAVDKRLANRHSEENLADLVESETVKKIRAGAFSVLYPNASDAVVVEEASAWLSGGGRARLNELNRENGVEEITEDEADNYLVDWTISFKETNKNADLTEFAKINEYATRIIEKSRIAITEGKNGGTNRAAQSNGRDSGQRGNETENPRTPSNERIESVSEENLKTRQTVLSAEELGAVEKGAITGDGRYYQLKSRNANIRVAQEIIEKDGLAKSTAAAKIIPDKISPEFTAFQMEVVNLLNLQADEAIKLGNRGFAVAKLGEAQEIVAALAARSTELGQSISQLAAWQKTDPNAVTGYVQKRRSQNQYQKQLTPEESAALRDKATELQDLNVKIAEMEAQIHDLEQELTNSKAKNKNINPIERAIAKELKSKSNDALKRIREQFVDAVSKMSSAGNLKLLAPNGKPSNLTAKQHVEVRTKAFKDWFGDWENDPYGESSHMLDENGEPKVFYHRTNADFDTFNKSFHGSSTDAGWLGEGFYFYGEQEESYGYGEKEVQAYLNIRNPYYAENEDNRRLVEADDIEISREFSDNLIGEGYDGVYFNGDLRQETVTFESNQIKSATGNNGKFSSNNDSILKSARPLSGLKTSKLDAEVLKDFTLIGADVLMNVEKGKTISLVEFRNSFIGMFGNDILPHVREIYANSVTELKKIKSQAYRARAVEALKSVEGNQDLTVEDLNEIVDAKIAEKKAFAKLRGQNKAEANKFFKEQEKFAKLEDIPNFAKSLFKVADTQNKEALVGALLLETGQVTSADELARKLREEFPELTPREALNTASVAARSRNLAHADLIAEKKTLKKKIDEKKAAASEAKKKRNDAQRKLLNRIKYLESPPPTYSERFGRVYKSALVAAVQTTVNNFLTAQGTRKLEAASDLGEVLINKTLRKISEKVGKDLNVEYNGKISADTRILDIFGFPDSDNYSVAQIVKHYFTDAVFARGIANSVLDEYPTMFEELFGSYSADVAVLRETSKTSKADKAMQAVEKTYEYANFLNYLQEFLVRSQEFNYALQLRLGAKGLNLPDVIKNNEIVEKITEEDLQFAVGRALRATFALKPDKDSFFGNLLLKYQEKTPGVVAPFFITFPNFLFNATKFVTDYLPAVGIAKAGYKASINKNNSFGQSLINEANPRVIAQQGVGLILFLSALALVRLAGDDDKWYYLKTPFTDADGNHYYQDVRGYQPFASFIFLANKINRLIDGKTAFSDKDTMITETIEAVTGLGARNIEQSKIINSIYYALIGSSQNDGKDLERVVYLVKQQLGDIAGGFLRPLKTFKDLIAQFDEFEAKQPDTTDAPFMQGIARSLPLGNRILRLTPRTDFVTGKESSQTAPLLRIFGISVVSPEQHRDIPSKALVTARELVNRFEGERDILPDAQKKAQVKFSLYRALRKAGEDTAKLEMVDKAIKRAEESGILQKGELEFIERKKGLTELESLAKSAKPEYIERILKVATDSEKILLNKILQNKNIAKEQKAEKLEVAEVKSESLKKLIDMRAKFGEKPNREQLTLLNADLDKLVDAKIISLPESALIRKGAGMPILQIVAEKEPKNAIKIFNDAIGVSSQKEKAGLITILRGKFNRSKTVESKQIYFNSLTPYLDEKSRQMLQDQITKSLDKESEIKKNQSSFIK